MADIILAVTLLRLFLRSVPGIHYILQSSFCQVIASTDMKKELICIKLAVLYEMKKCLKETLLLERSFEVVKVGLYSCRISHFSLEIFGFV